MRRKANWSISRVSAPTRTLRHTEDLRPAPRPRLQQEVRALLNQRARTVKKRRATGAAAPPATSGRRGTGAVSGGKRCPVGRPGFDPSFPRGIFRPRGSAETAGSVSSSISQGEWVSWRRSWVFISVEREISVTFLFYSNYRNDVPIRPQPLRGGRWWRWRRRHCRTRRHWPFWWEGKPTYGCNDFDTFGIMDTASPDIETLFPTRCHFRCCRQTLWRLKSWSWWRWKRWNEEPGWVRCSGSAKPRSVSLSESYWFISDCSSKCFNYREGKTSKTTPSFRF